MDIDVKGKHNGFQTLKDLNLSLPDTMVQTTPSGGKHYIFNYPKDGYDYTNKVGFLPGLDVRSRAGWIAYYGTSNKPKLDAPGWLLDQLRNTNIPKTDGSIINLEPQIALTMFQKCLDDLGESVEGERNHALNLQAFKVGQLLMSSSLTKDYAHAELTKVALDIGLSPDEIKTTLASAFGGGTTKPLTSPFPNTQPIIKISIPDPPQANERWTPRYMTKADLLNRSFLRKPQLFKNWSTEDIHITTADGGTGKTTLKLYEAVCLALGERFLGFDCKQPGKTLFITGEDTANKLAAMVGAIVNQMDLFDDTPESNMKIETILSSIVIKKDLDLCLINKDKLGFLTLSHQALVKVLQAIDDIKPKMIVFDPISSFWGSESALNDMNKAVSKFMMHLQEHSEACVEMINHMGKVSSQNKDMTQFAGRGGTGLPSHSRVSRVLRVVDEIEYKELTSEELPEKNSAMMCNVNKFTDGSPLVNKPFLIIREGFLFYRKDLAPQKQKDEKDTASDMTRVFEFIKESRLSKKYPTKSVIIGYFKTQMESLSEARTKRALDMLMFNGFQGEMVKQSAHPDGFVKDKIFIIEDMDGNEKYC